MAKDVIVIGAGVGGLGVALRLAHRGHRVTILEKNDAIGGRNRREKVGDCQFEGGPTLLLMLDPFRKLFKDVGEDFDTLVPCTLCDPSYRVFFADGTQIEGTTNQTKMVENIRGMSGDKDADAYPAFMAELKSLYEMVIPNFVRNEFRSILDFASPKQLSRVLGHHMLTNLAKRLKTKFDDPRLQMMFSFQTMYLGLSPYNAPWLYSTLAYMEYGEGVFYPKGGLGSISDKIAELAINRGTTIRLNANVTKISGSTVTLESGEILTADMVIANPDMPYAQRELIKKPTKRKLRYSCSAHLVYMDYEGNLEGFEHHNVLFGADFRGNLQAISDRPEIPKDPAFYLCNSSKTDPSLAPEGHSNLFLLIPVPNLEYTRTSDQVEAMENEVFDRLEKLGSFDRRKIRHIKRRGPAEWESELNLDRGAAFGIGHDLFQSAFMRPGLKSKENPNLYFVGASTLPGNGLPMVLISAELVEQRLIADGAIPA
jgi:phytoene desaturase